MGCIDRGAIGEPMDSRKGMITAVMISDDGNLIVTGSMVRTIRRWAAGTGEAIRKWMKGHSDLISSLSISTNGNLIVSGSYDGKIRRWNPRNGKN